MSCFGKNIKKTLEHRFQKVYKLLTYTCVLWFNLDYIYLTIYKIYYFFLTLKETVTGHGCSRSRLVFEISPRSSLH